MKFVPCLSALGRQRTRQGSGYKQVERWLHLMDGRTDNQGHALTSEQTVDAHRQIEQWRAEGRSLEGIGRSVVRPWTTSPPGITFAVSDA